MKRVYLYLVAVILSCSLIQINIKADNSNTPPFPIETKEVQPSNPPIKLSGDLHWDT